MSLKTWRVPESWQRFEAIEAHAAGEPLRILRQGTPEILGETMPAKRRYARENLDHLRRLVVYEPRGHADMYGCFLTEPVTPDGDVGVLFFHNEGFSTMCGHAVIALTTVAVEMSWFDGPTLHLDTPAGRVVATAATKDGRVDSVSFENVPSFVVAADAKVEVPGLGRLRCDVAFGGAFYAYVNAEDVGLDLEPDQFRRIIDLGVQIKAAVAQQVPIHHPIGDPDLDFLYGTIFVGGSRMEAAHSRNVCVFADGEVDRSPTGTGVSGRAALHFARNELTLGQVLTIESLIGTSFQVEVLATAKVGSLDAVVPRVTGSAFVTGRHEFVVDPADPLANGFLLR